MSSVGRAVPGLASGPLVAGRGTYINDLLPDDVAYAAFLRSPHALASIRSIETSGAEAVDGVLHVFTGTELADVLAPIPSGADAEAMGGRPTTWRALAIDRVRYVGEAVAAVVATDRWTAVAALDAIEVDYDELAAVSDPRAALEPTATRIEPDWPDNLRLRRRFGSGDPDAAFAAAPHRARGTVRLSRLSGAPIEPRGCIARYDPFSGTLEHWDATQQPHVLRTFLAETLRMPEARVRVRMPVVGGAFGLKQPLYQEQAVVAHAARVVARPVKWIEERAESLLAGGHARDTDFEYDVAFEADGRVTALRLGVLADVGAPTSLLGWTMAFVSAYHAPSTYDIANLDVELHAVSTTTCPWAPYRGFGKDAACFVLDRIMDHVARETGIDRAGVRLRNYIQPEAFPYARPGGAVLDSGDYPAVLRKLLAAIDYDRFPGRQARARAEGRRIGLGIGQELTPEGVAIPGSLMNSAYDGATVRISPLAEVTVLTGVTSPGSGSETAIAQLAADALGVPLDTVRVLHGDTELSPYGLGNFSSRSVRFGGAAVLLAARDLRDRLDRVAASMLGVEAADVRVVNGQFRGDARRPDRDDAGAWIPYAAVVGEIYRHTFGRHADGVEPGLESTRYYRSPNIYHQPETQGRFSTYPTWSNGAAACVVEVDPDTGQVRILDWVLVEDAGRIINPLLADANLHGGIAQGIGSAMFERIAYDESGQLLTGTLMDYTIPTAVELPRFTIRHHETPSPFTPLGMKGVGESGLSSAPGALASAIENAFPELDVRLTELPLTPERVWRAIRSAPPRRAERVNQSVGGER